MNSSPRKPDHLRQVTIKRNFIKTAHGSALVSFGDTKIICTAAIEEQVPPWMRGKGKGWVTAEYGMIPGSCLERKARSERQGKADGRTLEIQRLVGRSLRAVVDMAALGEISVWVDCDVIQADGGTRTASITGGFVALYDALRARHKAKPFAKFPIIDTVSAVSVGIVDGKPMLDLDYANDVRAEVDMNVVMTGSGQFVEVQGTAEGAPFSKTQLNTLLALAEKGLKDLHALQCKTLRL
jgi:ribonuclease PH